MLLLHAFVHLPSLLPPATPVPVLVFVGDGPARLELEAFCGQNGIDAVFMGHQTGGGLAECYASADLFAFPSFTETFGASLLGSARLCPSALADVLSCIAQVKSCSRRWPLGCP
jgi:glycosyltransferase involved in cell wall biosynthesis